jgi:hypothetical protein
VSKWLDADTRSTEVIYEDFVRRFPEAARRLVSFAGLPWEDACLEPGKNERTVLTASAAQVRRRVDGSAIGRWCNVATHLRGIESELADLIAAHERKLSEAAT